MKTLTRHTSKYDLVGDYISEMVAKANEREMRKEVRRMMSKVIRLAKLV